MTTPLETGTVVVVVDVVDEVVVEEVDEVVTNPEPAPVHAPALVASTGVAVLGPATKTTPFTRVIA
jgi:hypothetical protein